MEVRELIPTYRQILEKILLIESLKPHRCICFEWEGPNLLHYKNAFEQSKRMIYA